MREIRIKIYDDLDDNVIKLILKDLPESGLNVYTLSDGRELIINKSDKSKTELYKVWLDKNKK